MSIFSRDKTYNLELNKNESSVIYAFLTVILTIGFMIHIENIKRI